MKSTFIAIACFISIGYAGAQSKSSWYNLKSDSGKFSVDFPAQPEESDETVETDLGNIVMHMAILDLSADTAGDNLLFLSSWNDYPADKVNPETETDLDTFYESALGGSVENVKGKLISKKNITINGHRALTADVDYQEGQYVIRIQYLLIKNRFYMMEVITNASRNNNIKQTRFLDSFKVIK